jgi:hypothetical protein
MDWVLIYYLSLQFLSLLTVIYYMGKGGKEEEFKEPAHLIIQFFVGLIFGIPILGRLLGWW